MKFIDQRLLLLCIILLCSCTTQQKKTEASKRFEAELQLTLVHEWQIKAPSVVPNPRFAGVVLRDTSLILIDESLNTINRFNKKGQLIQTIGRTGRGPAEFLDITYATIHPSGKIAVADISNARLTIINLFSSDSLIIEPLHPGWHTRLHWVKDRLVITSHPFRESAHNPGDIFMCVYDPQSGQKKSFYQMELKLGDAAPPDQLSCTFCEFHFLQNLSFFTSPEDTSYQIYHVNPQTGQTLLFTRKGVPAVEYTQKELQMLQQQKQRMYQRVGKSYQANELPTHKPRFIDYFPDQSGRLWALLTPPAGKSPVFDIFTSDGTYIGSVQAPGHTQSAQFVPGGYILFTYRTNNPNIWKGGLYEIIKTPN